MLQGFTQSEIKALLRVNDNDNDNARANASASPMPCPPLPPVIAKEKPKCDDCFSELTPFEERNGKGMCFDCWEAENVRQFGF